MKPADKEAQMREAEVAKLDKLLSMARQPDVIARTD
jgi:hypothetical protein